MLLRLRGPDGTKRITLADNGTFGDLGRLVSFAVASRVATTHTYNQAPTQILTVNS
jgi:hypothetical protein